MKNYILFLCALITLGFASSCKQPTDFDTDRWNDKDTTTYPAPQELAGEWYLVSYEQFGSPAQYVSANEVYSLNFETSKKVSGKANCNTFTAKYKVGTTLVNGSTSDKEIDFEDIVSTKMNCGTAEDDAKFLTALNASVQYFVFDKMLEITYTGGNSTQAQRMIFKRKETQPQPDFDLLKGSEWTLVWFQHFGQTAEWIPVAQQEVLNISFLGDSLAVGMAECGKFSARYSTNNKPLPGTTDYPLGMSITNSVPCNGNYGSRFLEALKASKSYFRMGDSLEINYAINQGGTASRMMFVRKKATTEYGSSHMLWMSSTEYGLNQVMFKKTDPIYCNYILVNETGKPIAWNQQDGGSFVGFTIKSIDNLSNIYAVYPTVTPPVAPSGILQPGDTLRQSWKVSDEVNFPAGHFSTTSKIRRNFENNDKLSLQIEFFVQ